MNEESIARANSEDFPKTFDAIAHELFHASYDKSGASKLSDRERARNLPEHVAALADLFEEEQLAHTTMLAVLNHADNYVSGLVRFSGPTEDQVNWRRHMEHQLAENKLQAAVYQVKRDWIELADKIAPNLFAIAQDPTVSSEHSTEIFDTLDPLVAESGSLLAPINNPKISMDNRKWDFDSYESSLDKFVEATGVLSSLDPLPKQTQRAFVDMRSRLTAFRSNITQMRNERIAANKTHRALKVRQGE